MEHEEGEDEPAAGADAANADVVADPDPSDEVEESTTESAAAAAPSRWVCEACGCHTNAASDRTCTICGSHPSGPSAAIRRMQASAVGGSVAGYRAGWLARGLGAASGGGGGGGPSAAARRAMAAGILGLHNPDDELSLDDDDLWESVMHGMGDIGYYRPSRATSGTNANSSNSASNSNNNNDHHPELSILMDLGAAGGASETSSANNALSRNVETSRQRYIEAARAFREASHPPPRSAAAAPPPVDADALMQAATANASQYQPVWTSNPSALVGTGRSQHSRVSRHNEGRGISSRSTAHGSNQIQVGDGNERQNLAHVPAGVGEGRAIRAETPLPRSDVGNGSASVFASFRAASLSNSASGSGSSAATAPSTSSPDDGLKKRAFGFRVAFDHPTSGDIVGANMGGCYLVGVTTSAFTAYGDQDTLRQSPLFWGIEDGGQIYEGARHFGVGGSGRPEAPRRSGAGPSAAALYALDGINGSSSAAATAESQLNAHSVLFGAREVVTVICDIELRTLTFWRDETLLGTLVTNLPRSGQLYPVAVPFNCGVTVAITGLDGDPLEHLQTFADDCKKQQQEKDDEIRNQIARERSIMIENGKPTERLLQVLREIFLLYADTSTEQSSDVEQTLPYTKATRLWYRSGLKLSHLDGILENREAGGAVVTRLQDFLSLVEKVIEEDESQRCALVVDEASEVSDFEIGDKVELAEGFEKYGDALGGPLLVGDRGVVVELQRGPNGEKRSVRVFHSGRRWWYQPQAILSERSGLIASPAVWFVSHVLRSHGYDPSSLASIVGTPLTATSWRVGDVVAPSDVVDDVAPLSGLIGRVVTEVPSASSSSVSPHTRQSETVVVEYTGRAFADAVGMKSSSLSLNSISTLDTRRIRTSKLVHTTDLHGSALSVHRDAMEVESSNNNAQAAAPPDSSVAQDLSQGPVREKVMADIEAVGRLERSAMESLTKECKKGSDALASLFSAGLPDAVMSALEIADRQLNSLDTKDDLAEKLAAVGDLANAITDQLYGERKEATDEMETEAVASQPHDLLQNLPRSIRNQTGRADGRRRGQDSTRGTGRDVMGGESEDADVPLNQRRNMLMSLMSRASNRSNAGSFLNDLAEAGIESLGQIPRSVGQISSGNPFVFGSSSGMLTFDPHSIAFGNAHQELAASNNEQSSSPPTQPDPDAKPLESTASFLDSILRQDVDISAAHLAKNVRNGGAENAVWARQLASHAILPNFVDWAAALVDKYSKKGQLGAAQRSSSLMRSMVDEEGSPLLYLAVSFGCSTLMINRLVGWGAPVSAEVLRKAAATNQPSTLAALLQHTSYKEGAIDLDSCTPDVRRVLVQTISRQTDLDQRMRDAAGNFMVQLLIKIFDLGLTSRRLQTSPVDMCSKVICEILVGNVLLRALRWGQSSNSEKKEADDEGEHDPMTRPGNLTIEGEEIDTALLPLGLLGSLPCAIVGDFLLSDTSHLATFLLLCEDYLCSKEAADVAAGLALLSTILTKFPQLRYNAEMVRFGMSEFVANHSVLSSNRIADILSKQLNVGLDVSTSQSATDAGAISEHSQTLNSGVAVLCPKKHKAVLHITRHSSFRCDICGCAVPKGEYIFGCRQCDYDECLHCTLRNEKRTLGVQMMIRELAADCARMLAARDEVIVVDDDDGDSLGMASPRSEELDALSIRLLRRDVLAVRDLGAMLSESGRITIHEFLSVILPALHASLVGHGNNNNSLATTGPTHRSKKARSTLYSTLDSPDARIEYCREALLSMAVEARQSSVLTLSLDRAIESVADPSDMQVDAVKSTEEQKETEVDDGGKVNIRYSPSVSEILRRLHQILSFFESVQVLSTSAEKAAGSSTTSNAGDLQSLTKPLELHLLPSEFHKGTRVSPSTRAVVFAEPLLRFSELQLHVLRTYRIADPVYTSFCLRLVADSAIIVERPSTNDASPWRIGLIAAYDESTGAHSVRYASGWKRGQEQKELRIIEGTATELSSLRFYGAETSLVLAARQYYVLFRKRSAAVADDAAALKDVSMHDEMAVEDSPHELTKAIGTRVESNCCRGGTWTVMTLVARDTANESADRVRYILVSDEGELFYDVPADKIRANGNGESTRSRRRIMESDTIFPFFASARHRSEYGRGDADSLSASANQAKALKRTWSALSLLEEMRPVDLKVSDDTTGATGSIDDEPTTELDLICQMDDVEFHCHVLASAVECHPRLRVLFSTHEKLPTVALPSSDDRTLVCALKELNQKQQKWTEWPPKPTCKLSFSVTVEFPELAANAKSKTAKATIEGPQTDTIVAHSARPNRLENRSRKLSSRSLSIDEEENFNTDKVLCDGVDEICVQCMEVIMLISECADDPASKSDRDVLNLPGFANPSLSSKLSEQLEDVLCGVGAALPDWCLIAASYAPRVFSYESRRMLLERAAFGPSRSTLKQQEAKVNVGRLRQRMTSLRARAVELVGEAFSGGADDPTALQLQADELYGMEEALATRVRAAFHAVKWQEHTLQVAKAAVRRERLLADAAALMESYANDRSVCRRRLEVRFEGESGFDAASGDEAGVTRGFYADVAEALLSTDNVAGVFCASPCSQVAVAAAVASSSTSKVQDVIVIDDDSHKLPLWIPDMDSSAQVILPSPRADKKSGLGIFPRPIPHYHPRFDDVLQRFRFIGRLFAAAMRDGFMFPLPLSSAFLKLVQSGNDNAHRREAQQTTLLHSSDLPRPGFLGGEVYAIDYHICRALDNLSAADPPLSRHELKRRYEEIATDKNFARVAFGKSYDCSFEEFVQDRAFVDPLDPAQDANAHPLCSKGHTKTVTIYNVREWVAAAKYFMLHEGVIQQALAFRDGINDFFSADFLRVFTSEELQRDVCGSGDDVENWNESSIRKLFKLDGGKGAAEALVAVAAIGGEGGAALSRRFGPSSPTIAFLVKALLEATSKQRRQFLSFVTSVPIVTPGRIEVVPILSPNGEFLPMRDPSCLPRANTCSRRLYLPKFETFDCFSEVLWAVVEEESKFKGFYEWRGN